MILQTLDISNFGPIETAHLNLQGKGLVAIEGVNLDGQGADSNGSGKSSIINAILWCNYGHIGKNDVSPDDVVNLKDGKGTWVGSTWFDPTANITYSINRYRKHAIFKNSLIVYSIKDGVSSDISKGTNAETQKLIDEILGQDLDTFFAHSFARQGEAVEIPALKDTALKNLLESVLPLDDLDAKYKLASANLNCHHEKLSSLQKQLEEAEIEMALFKSQGEASVSEYKAWADNRTLQIAAMRDELDLLVKEKTIYSAGVKSPQSIKRQLEDAAIRLAAYDPAEYKLALNSVEDIKQEIAAHESNIVDIDELVKCVECGQTIAEKDKLLENFKDKLETAKLALEVEAVKLEKAIENKKKREDIVALQSELNIALTQSILSMEKLAQYELREKELRAKIDGPAINPFADTVQRLRRGYRKAKHKVDELRDTLEFERASLPLLEAVAKVFSPKGLRYHLLEQVTPYLNDRTDYYLRLLSDGEIKAIWSTVSKLKSGEYREKFSIEVSFGKITKYGMLSGGEKRKVQIACFLALQDLIASKATKSISIWCADEIDHALDSSGLERLMDVLHAKAKEKSTILVISHNELSEYIPNTVTVTKHEGISKITGYLN